MSRQALEVADIFRARGETWRQAHRGHISLGQLKVMSAIEACRTAALGGHVLHCQGSIANSRLLRFDDQGVTFKWKDYRGKQRFRHKTMTLKTDEFIRRFLIHVLPGGFHRIRHYGLLANSGRRGNLKQARELLMLQSGDGRAHDITPCKHSASRQDDVSEQVLTLYICPDCGGPMVIIECFERGQLPRAPPAGRIAA